MERMDTPDTGPHLLSLQRKAWAVLAVLCLAATLSSLVYVYLQNRHNSHAAVVYLGLLYLVVLPLLLAYWRLASYGRLAKGTEESRFRISAGVAVAAGVLFATTALWVSSSVDHGRIISDESAYRFQARVFADGKLKAEAMPGALANPAADPVEIYFEQTIQAPDGWYAKYPPGWPLILAAGSLLHSAWLLNPIFGVLQLLVMWNLARRWGSNTQVLAVLIAATSPYMVINNAGYMSHACEALVSLLALGFVMEGVRRQRLAPIVLSFGLVFVAILIRPFTGAVVAALCTFIVIFELRSHRRLLLWALAVVAVTGAASVASTLVVNQVFTGHLWLSPYALARGGTKIREITLNPAEIVTNITHLWRWSAISTFPFLLAFAAYGCWRENTDRRELCYLAGLVPLLFAAYCFQFEGSGSSVGERYYYEGFCPLAIASGRGLDLLLTRWRTRPLAIAAGVAVLLGLQFLTFGRSMREIANLVHPYNEAYSFSISSPQKALVFLGGNTPYFTSKHVNWNEVKWRTAPIVYLNDPGPTRRDAAACRFGRPDYRVVWWDAEQSRMRKLDATASCAQRDAAQHP